MGRAMKPETEIRNLKRLLKGVALDRDRNKLDAVRFRAKSQTLEAEVAEWKERFDALLAFRKEEK